MARRPTLSRLELRIMEVLWTRGACSVREIHEALPQDGRPAFTTVGTMVYRLEKKQALRCVKRISNANIFEAVISRDQAHTTLVDDLLALFDGRPRPVMARLVESGKLTLDDIREAEDALRKTKLKAKTKTTKKGGPQ
jgi:BlaI family transcriptional regulator, penicillinase repressor